MKLNYSIDDPPKKNVPAIIKFDQQSVVDHMMALFGDSIKKLKKQVDSLVVTDEKTIAKATEMATKVKRLAKVVDDKRKEIKEPYLKFGQTLDAAVRNIRKPLIEFQKTLEAKIAPVALAIEEKRIAEAKAEAKKAAKIQKDTGIQAPVIKKPSVVSEGKVQASHGTVTVEKIWKWDIVDFEKIPDAYKVVTIDEKLVQSHVDQGRKIPGIKAYQDTKVNTRLKRG